MNKYDVVLNDGRRMELQADLVEIYETEFVLKTSDKSVAIFNKNSVSSIIKKDELETSENTSS